MKAILLAVTSVILVNGPNDATWNPPARFDHPFVGELQVLKLDQIQVALMCATMLGVPFDNYMQGCSERIVLESGKVKCTVIIPKTRVLRASPKAILRHELGHCNGWGRDHEN